ncbi:uncharacterized protein LOC133201899 [Saccostrea echinata]|uniref:uncharacterized protein LOC133201899 n=1 Tax=Saccostrea echinata TaxID=191078 RepID=UPI002A7F8576|nr:uncharacterized protein LOC133201899 [Saccostrea echinata]
MKLLFLITCVLCAFSVNCDTPSLPIERPADIRTEIPPSDIVSPEGQTIIIVDEDPIINSPTPPLPPPIADPDIPNGLDIAEKLAESNIDLSSFAKLEPEKLNSILDNILKTVNEEINNPPPSPPVDPPTPIDQIVQDARINQIQDNEFGLADNGPLDQSQIDRLLGSLQGEGGLKQPNIIETPLPTPDVRVPILNRPTPTPDVPVPTVNDIGPTPGAPLSEFPSIDTTELDKELKNIQEEILRTSVETQLPDLREPTLPPNDNLGSAPLVIQDLERNEQIDTIPSELGLGEEFTSTVRGNFLEDGFDSDQAKRLATLLEQRREIQRRLREQEQIIINSPAPNPLLTRRAPFRNINRAATGRLNFFDEFGNSIDDISSVSSPLVGNSISVGRDIITDSESLQNNRVFDALAQAGQVNAPENIRQIFSDDDGINSPPPSISSPGIVTRNQADSASARITEAMRNDPYIMPGRALLTDTSGQTRGNGISFSPQQQELNALLTQRELLEDQLSRISSVDIQTTGGAGDILPIPRNTRLSVSDDDNNGLPERVLNLGLNERGDLLRAPQGTNTVGRRFRAGLSNVDDFVPFVGLGRLRQQNLRRALTPSQITDAPFPRGVRTGTFSENDDIEPRILGFQNRRGLSSSTRIGPVVGDTQRSTPLSTAFRSGFVDTLPSSVRASSGFIQSDFSGSSSLPDDIRESFIGTTRARQNLLQSGRTLSGTRQTVPTSTSSSSFFGTLSPRLDRTPLSLSSVDLDDDVSSRRGGDTQSLGTRNSGRETGGFLTQTFDDFPEFNRQVAQLMSGASGFGSVSFRNLAGDDFRERSNFRTFPVGNIGNRRTLRFFRPQRRTFSTRIF